MHSPASCLILLQESSGQALPNAGAMQCHASSLFVVVLLSCSLATCLRDRIAGLGQVRVEGTSVGLGSY